MSYLEEVPSDIGYKVLRISAFKEMASYTTTVNTTLKGDTYTVEPR